MSKVFFSVGITIDGTLLVQMEVLTIRWRQGFRDT